MSEELIVRHCSPTLAGLKTANMFSCEYVSPEKLRQDVISFNRRFACKGIQAVALKKADNKALMYVYRPSKLKKDLESDSACKILSEYGYDRTSPGRCIVRLSERLKTCGSFPHEIGLFLGYPPEDVIGFIENDAKNYKYMGCWKVYSNEANARKTFARYKKCTDVYMKQFANGNTIERLTVAI